MTIRDLLERSAKLHSDRIALTWCEDKVWKNRTWKEHLERVRAVAEGYGQRFALKPHEDNAAIILGNSPTWMESYLAQSGTGVSVVPIDPKLHNDEVAYILKDAQVRVVTTDKAHLKMFMEISKRLPDLKAVVITDGAVHDGQKIDDRVEVVEYAKLFVAGGGSWYDSNVAGSEDIASIIYTSGTTGKPKGAMLTHENFYQDIEGALKTFNANLTFKDSVFVVLPLFHAFSFTTNFPQRRQVQPSQCSGRLRALHRHRDPRHHPGYCGGVRPPWLHPSATHRHGGHSGNLRCRGSHGRGALQAGGGKRRPGALRL